MNFWLWRSLEGLNLTGFRGDPNVHSTSFQSPLAKLAASALGLEGLGSPSDLISISGLGGLDIGTAEGGGRVSTCSWSAATHWSSHGDRMSSRTSRSMPLTL